MHTRTFIVDASGERKHAVMLHYNSDMSGSVHVVVMNKQGESKEVLIPGWVLVDFVAEQVAGERIRRLESNPREALGVSADWPPRWGNEGSVPRHVGIRLDRDERQASQEAMRAACPHTATVPVNNGRHRDCIGCGALLNPDGSKAGR